ncbi:Cobyrinic acid a,c-diamide synthase CbiA [Methyloversatilis universalis FAM5]|uniref:Cobyrinic acid a,c-diamide synthase CbiA n=1 Tax=Methyloversatilis universalis (strain ATCC BAA-1314 / DSM 25237 / JCM 13912 / CCUG 52030 / FAM5) TaxID=1000565 RepID=F5RFV1_METUF|nr:cobyrinate a,c-diamide synthase [Methyloversatilis universalis]EGK70439.1 Cobyrinic acid a,c-diamide synthase CbiA [Methyloversatilis universalis FAM5]
MVAAPASGQGKTTVVAALARLHRSRGRRVRVFKCGPDFLDPQIHALASGAPVCNVDLWMTGDADIAARLYEAAGDADLILVESVMGLYDGSPSSADIARRFNLPVLAVIDARAMAQTFGALAHGLKHYRDGVNLSAVIANRVGSARHLDILRDSLPADIAWYGGLPRDERIALPERHLGLLPAAEIEGLDARLDIAAELLGASTVADLPPAVDFAPVERAETPRLLDGVRIALARDDAFCFIYPANLDGLRALGAELVEFSPLNDAALPACDAVWLPGGYPELHAARWAANTAMHAALRAHVDAGRPLLAECGGMMSLFDTLTDKAGVTHAAAGLLPGAVRMQTRLAALGLQQVELPEGALRGHTFHYSTADTPLAALTHARTADGRDGEAVYRLKRLTASYVHLYFPSDPAAAAALFRS